MGLTSLGGSADPADPSSPTINDKVINVTSDTPTMDQFLESQVYPEDIYTNRTALNTDRNDDVLDAIKGFSEGTPIKGTWYHQMDGTGTVKTAGSDISFLSSSINQSFLKINHFELRLQGPMDFSYDEDLQRSALSGQALIFPGFVPKQADLFLYEIEPGQIGIFRVSKAPERLSIRTKTSHVVSLILYNIADGNDISEILDRVRDEAWFDKQRFLNEETALLTYDEVIDLKFIDNNYAELFNHYRISFFDTDSSRTFIRPDGFYDPYMINFIKETVDLYEFNIHCEQLLDSAPYFKSSLWTKVTSRERYNWKSISLRFEEILHQPAITSYTINALINKRYVSLLEPDSIEGDKYISDNINGIDQNLFNGFERLFALYMEYGVIDVEELQLQISTMYDEDPIDQFYRIPFILYMLLLLGNSIKTGTKVKITAPGVLPYAEIPITATDANYDIPTNIATFISPDSEVVGLLDDNNVPVFLDLSDIVYTVDGFTISFVTIITNLALTEIPNTWKVIISNPNLVLT